MSICLSICVFVFLCVRLFTFCIGREMLCFPYAGLFFGKPLKHARTVKTIISNFFLKNSFKCLFRVTGAVLTPDNGKKLNLSSSSGFKFAIEPS